MSNFTLTSAVDNVGGTKNADTIFGTAGTLNSKDRIDGNGDTDTLALSGGGSFDLNLLASFTQVEVVTLDDMGSTLRLRNVGNGMI